MLPLFCQPRLHGAPAAPGRLDRESKLPHAIKSRSVEATVLRRGWGLRSERMAGRRFELLPIVRG